MYKCQRIIFTVGNMQ